MFNLKFHLSALVIVLTTLVIYVHSDVPRPRGVSLSKASLYNPSKDFTCFDGTVTIPFSYVNDDYCDCFDGSDEPGTSACLNSVFHCTNAGHRPQNIPSSRVNDGICDCCDGTDEYASSEKCSNICEELGREARAEAQRLAELYKAGHHLRIDLIEKGNKKRSEMAQQLEQLEKDKTEAEKIKVEKEALKSEIEEKENEALKVYREAAEQERLKKVEEEHKQNREEAEDYFVRFDSDRNGQLTVIEVQVRNIFDKDRNGEVSEEEAKYFLGERDSIDLDEFVSTTWPLLKPLLMMEQGMFRPEASQPEGVHDDHLDTDEGDKELLDEHEDLEDGDHVEEAEHLDSELPIDETEKQIYDEDTQRIVNHAIEARQQFTEAERTVREIEANIRNIKQNLEKDYGLHQEYATLDGQCFEFEDKEYIYKLCLFQKAIQKSKNGGSEVGLGNWGEWVGDDSYKVMKYTNGVACWNGPNRSTTVNIQCGLESKIISVSEPFRCEYKMEFSTPAACDNTKVPEHSHDEL